MSALLLAVLIASPAPSPQATAQPCATLYKDAMVKTDDGTLSAVFEAAPHGETLLRIDVTAQGTAKKITLVSTTADSALDVAPAIGVAKRLQFFPKVVRCQAVPGTYLLRIRQP